ncbi:MULTISPECIES: carbohydrate porin [unclassified Brenneria]|uniref:carbohydrate porin n=1 Tax=unclassified Brenneria TaxID=2634434 RepID=UPI0029C408E3|nr:MULTISPECIES: carbohydrate porin [unclassified Brenneria]MDX5627577.1 carbohydrate porin [Brenneria sp. L3-3Z]MDX5695332.1 carbohydrate porin [Brenneria sp. L4-2C]
MKITHHNMWMRMLSVGVVVSGMMLTNGAAVAADDAEQSGRPLSDAGTWLADRGITPHLFASQLWLGNPSAGTTTDEHQTYTMFFAGADFNLDQMGLIPGGNIHFLQLWVPFSHNLEYGNKVGGMLAGDPPPYIPKTAHLMRFTYEQKLLDDRLSIELGKSNPGQFFGFTNCNIQSSCVNTILNKTAVFGPAPYAGWGARIGYRFTPALESNVGVWRTYQAFPFTNGWERWDDDYKSGNTLLVANVARRVNWRQEPYPFNWEAMAFHNFLEYDDIYYTVNGTSKVYDGSAAARSRDGVSGVYLTAKKALWRRDGGADAQDPSPSAISLHGSVTQTLQSNAYTGASTLADVGLIWSGPWQSRPHDSYGLTFRWGRLTEGGQRYSQDMFNALGGTGWQAPRNEYQLSIDASVMLTPEINLQMTGSRVWNNSNWQYVYSNVKPEDGYTFWLQLNVMLDKLLGL